MNKFKVGSLVKRKMYRGVLNSLHIPSSYGIITKIDAEGQFQVTFITRNGNMQKQFIIADELILIY